MKLSKTDFLDVHQAFLELHNLYYLCNALRQNKLKIVFKWFILGISLNIDSFVQLRTGEKILKYYNYYIYHMHIHSTCTEYAHT